MATSATEFLLEFPPTALDVGVNCWLLCVCCRWTGRRRKRQDERTNHEDEEDSGEAGHQDCEARHDGGESDARKATAKKLSQIEAAIQVLAKAGEPMNCKSMVAKGL